MQLDLTRYRRPLDHFSRTFEPSEVPADGDSFVVVAPVVLDFDIHKDKDKFRLVGSVRTELELPCSRCLEPFRLPVEATFDQRYLPAADATQDAEVELGEEDVEVSYYRDDAIDLAGLMREQFYLALPMKPLCNDDCKGLCPQCGTNRNVSQCSCTQGWVDPRLAALQALKTRES